MNPIYIDALWWLFYAVTAVCVAGVAFVALLWPAMLFLVCSGVASGKKD